MSNLAGWCRFLVLGVPVFLAAPASAQTVPDAARECRAAPVEYTDEEGLTSEERIRRMDRAFTRSLNRFDECQQAEDDRLAPRRPDMSGPDGESGDAEASGRASSEAASGTNGEESLPAIPGDVAGHAGESAPVGERAGQAGGVSGNEGVSGNDGNDNLGTGAPSVAAGGISGDEPEAVPATAAGSAGAGAERNSTQAGQAGGTENGAVAGTGPPVLQNGKLPEDIPPADNDSVLEAQIRQAAIDEPDPELKKKLWNEYRRYKGLPQVN